MFLMVFSSGFHEYYSIGEDTEKLAKEILKQYNKNCYHEKHTLKELAKKNESFLTYEFKGMISFDDSWNGLPKKSFDYLEKIREAARKEKEEKRKPIPDYIDLDYLEKNFVKHHTAKIRCYESRKGNGHVERYKGRFGKGFAWISPNKESSVYSYITYYIEK